MSVEITTLTTNAKSTSVTPPQSGLTALEKKILEKFSSLLTGSSYDSEKNELTFYNHKITCSASADHNNTSIGITFNLENLKSGITAVINSNGVYKQTIISDGNDTTYSFDFNATVTCFSNGNSRIIGIADSFDNITTARSFYFIKILNSQYFGYFTSSNVYPLYDSSGDAIYQIDSLQQNQYSVRITANSNQASSDIVLFIEAAMFNYSTGKISSTSTPDIIAIYKPSVAKGTFINILGKIYYIIAAQSPNGIAFCCGEAEEG